MRGTARLLTSLNQFSPRKRVHSNSQKFQTFVGQNKATNESCRADSPMIKTAAFDKGMLCPAMKHGVVWGDPVCLLGNKKNGGWAGE
jgi:hypothetical protein